MPGYSNDEELGVTFLEWGSGSDIFQYEPPETCPMPQTEKLSNYLLRLIQTLSLADFVPGQGTERGLKTPSLRRNQILFDLWQKVGAVDATLQNAMAASLANIDASINVLGSAVTADIGDLRLQLVEKLGLFIEHFELLRVELNALKIEVGRFFVDEVNIDIENADLSGLSAAIDRVDATLKDMTEELENQSIEEGVLEIGKDSYYLKSKVVRS